MDTKDLRGQLTRLIELVDGWTERIPAIERDLALDKLKALYEAVKYADPVVPGEDVSPDRSVVSEVSIPLDDLLSAAAAELHDADIPAPFTGNVPLPEPPVEPEIPEPEPPVEPEISEPEPASEPQSPPETPEPTAPRLFDTDELTPRHREKRRVILSLYDNEISVPVAENTSPRETAEPIEPPVEPARQEPVRESTPPAPHERIGNLRTAIGLNDRYLLVGELFGGDEQAFETTIDRLDAFDNLEDCLIHIAENYDWNPASEGAKLLVELLERKLL